MHIVRSFSQLHSWWTCVAEVGEHRSVGLNIQVIVQSTDSSIFHDDVAMGFAHAAEYRMHKTTKMDVGTDLHEAAVGVRNRILLFGVR